MRASSLVELMRDPLDLYFQPAFALTPYRTTDDGCDVRHRFVDCNCRLVMHERVDDCGDQLGALVPSTPSRPDPLQVIPHGSCRCCVLAQWSVTPSQFKVG